MTERCTHTVASYLDAIIRANQSGGCIDAAESKALFQAAHVCNVATTGNDGIQMLFKQITGILNTVQGSLDPRLTVSGTFRTYHKEGHSGFSDDLPYSTDGNVCINFDPVQKDRKTICTPDQSEKPDELVVPMSSLPIQWCDGGYHVNARNGAYVIADATNWRVLLQNDPGKPLIAKETALDMVRKNMAYPEVVEQAIRLGFESTSDPWEVSRIGCDVFDALIAARGIDESAKLVYAQYTTTYATARLNLLPDPVYKLAFNATFGKSKYTFEASNMSKTQLAGQWRDDYHRDGVGLWHGGVDTLLLTGGAAYIAPALIKGAYVAVTSGLAAGGAVIAGIPPLAIAAVVVGAISLTALYIYSRFKAEDSYEMQFEKRVTRFELPRPNAYAER